MGILIGLCESFFPFLSMLSEDFLSSTHPASERCCFPHRSRHSPSSLDPYRFATGRKTNDVALPLSLSTQRLRPPIPTEQLKASVSKDVSMVDSSASVERSFGLLDYDPRLRMLSVQLSESLSASFIVFQSDLQLLWKYVGPWVLGILEARH